MKSPKKEDKLVIPIFANVNKKVFKTKIEKPKNKIFINKKKKRNNELYIPLKQQLSAFKNQIFISLISLNFCGIQVNNRCLFCITSFKR